MDLKVFGPTSADNAPSPVLNFADRGQAADKRSRPLQPEHDSLYISRTVLSRTSPPRTTAMEAPEPRTPADTGGHPRTKG